MAEDLRNYRLQLQQVEAALLTDPNNEELLKLKTDLEEVIELTQDLIKTQESESESNRANQSQNDDDVTASLLAAEEDLLVGTKDSKKVKWKPGDRCVAKWAKDRQLYDAVVDEVNGDVLKVIFDGYKTQEAVSIADVKPLTQGIKRGAGSDDDGSGKNGKPGLSRDYLKKKKQKKQQRYKQIEEERETDKNKWLNFHSKSTKKPGVKGKSIFASPDSVTGRVGIGTCGISGKPMTEFTHGEKWKKGA